MTKVNPYWTVNKSYLKRYLGSWPKTFPSYAMTKDNPYCSVNKRYIGSWPETFSYAMTKVNPYWTVNKRYIKRYLDSWPEIFPSYTMIKANPNCSVTNVISAAGLKLNMFAIQSIISNKNTQRFKALAGHTWLCH